MLVLGSASYLGLCLVCTYGTPVADMLAHSPPLPLVIDYFQEDGDITREEEGVVVALEQRDRVRRVRLFPNPQKLIMAFDGEYPVLEYLTITAEDNSTGTALMLPETFQAPNLRHLTLTGFALPIESRLLTTAMGLITLSLYMAPSTYFRPSTLLQWISFMPQLETLVIDSLFPIPNQDVESQLMHTPITTHVTLPNLRSFSFQGGSAYLEEVVRRIITPRLEEFSIEFYEQLTYSVPRLVQFMNTTKFDGANFEFSSNQISVEFYFRGDAKPNTLTIYVNCSHLNWQVSSVAQLFDSLSQMFSAVEYLTLEQEVRSRPSDEHNEVNRGTVWRRLLTSFGNVKTLLVDDDRLVKELSRCLRQDGEEHASELLPELKELRYSGRGNADKFTSFIEARQNAGRPVTLICHIRLSEYGRPRRCVLTRSYLGI